MSIIASAKLGARLLRVSACSGSLGSCSSCRGSSRGKVSSQGGEFVILLRYDISELQETGRVRKMWKGIRVFHYVG